MAEGRATVNVEVSLHGFNPEQMPLVMAFGKNGRYTAVWWKGERIDSLLAAYAESRTAGVKLLFSRIPDSRFHAEQYIARQQRVMDEAKAAGYTVLLEQ